jgi:hypothetical protein
MSDARFEDGMDKPLRLIAFDAEDLQVLSIMTQDAVWPGEADDLARPRAPFCNIAQPLPLGGPWRSPGRARAIRFELLRMSKQSKPKGSAAQIQIWS